ncbi:MAG: glutamine synthetase family protein [Bacteroidota bacterium]
MVSAYIELNPSPLVQFLQKPMKDFTKEDLIRFIREYGVEMINFRYVGGDGRLKTLNFVISSREYLDSVLSTGERVDGSSLFSHIEAGSSDLYVVPRYGTAFLNPFTEVPTLELLCSYFDKDGNPLASAPEQTLIKARQSLISETGFDLDAMGELEYYVIGEKEALYPARDQKGYHESGPFAKYEYLRTEAMQYIAQAGGVIKYGHSEVGNFVSGNKYFEQNEIEFLPTDIRNAADQMIIAKWIIRMLGYKYGAEVSFAPKITVGKAGSGLHIHMRLMKDGKSVMIRNGILSDEARKAIAGILNVSPALCAFGNTIPTSFLRLVPHQEAPTSICWGDRNRSVLVRVPLGWSGKASQMIRLANPQDLFDLSDHSGKQTVEFRGPDGSADIYLLLAGLTVAVRHGIQMPDALELAEKLYVDVNIFHDEHRSKCDELDKLPNSCWETANQLLKHRSVFEAHKVFSPGLIDNLAERLKQYGDKDLSEKLFQKNEEVREFVEKFLHC